MVDDGLRYECTNGKLSVEDMDEDESIIMMCGLCSLASSRLHLTPRWGTTKSMVLMQCQNCIEDYVASLMTSPCHFTDCASTESNSTEDLLLLFL